MVPYLLTGLSVLVAGIIHWHAPRTFWKATVMSTAVILLLSVAALYIFQAAGMLNTETSGQAPDLTSYLMYITALVSFFGLLVSVFVGWFLRVVRN